jgi:[acyl-carrier-protein] S-malonyltransferase
MKDAVFLFPGQGSQYVGMGRSHWENHPSVKRLFEEASDLVGQDLKALCFEGPESILVQTDNVQPAITLVNLAALEVLREHGVVPSATAGHSLGEYAALCAAGVLSFADTMRLVHFRGRAMKEAADRHPGGMSAVFGLEIETLAAICREVADVGSVEVANHNSPRQVILTGEKDALQRAAEIAKKKGAKLIVPLKVSGPWHSRFMAEASDRMREKLSEVSLGKPSIPVVSNVTAEPHPQDPERIRKTLVDQIISPVRWSSSIGWLVQQGHRLFLEVGPGKVLTGMMKDIDREAKIFPVQDAGSLAKALDYRPDSIPA